MKVIMYTDGAAKGNPGPGGYGTVLLHKDLRKELSEGYRLTTNNRMELTVCGELCGKRLAGRLGEERVQGKEKSGPLGGVLKSFITSQSEVSLGEGPCR